MEQSDEQLIAAAREGDDGALPLLIRRYLAPVYRLAFGILRDKQEAEDAAQDTFFNIWRNLKKYTPGRQPKAWILGIARNAAIDRIRKKKPSVFSDFEDTEGENVLLETHAGTDPLPDEAAFASADRALIAKAADMLPPLYREVLALHYGQGLTFDEIAAIINASINTVKSRHRRALIRLRSLLAAPAPKEPRQP